MVQGDRGVGRGQSRALPGDLSLEARVDEAEALPVLRLPTGASGSPEASRALPRLDGRWPGTRSLSRIQPLQFPQT